LGRRSLAFWAGDLSPLVRRSLAFGQVISRLWAVASAFFQTWLAQRRLWAGDLSPLGRRSLAFGQAISRLLGQAISRLWTGDLSPFVVWTGGLRRGYNGMTRGHTNRAVLDGDCRRRCAVLGGRLERAFLLSCSESNSVHAQFHQVQHSNQPASSTSTRD